MKKIIAILLAFALAALAACGGASAPTQPAETPTPTEMPQPTGEGRMRTVTVSTIEELVDAIGSNTRIILKTGTYNFTQLDVEELDNPKIEPYWTYYKHYNFTITGVSDLTMEANEGAEVSIVTEDSAATVLDFSYCSNITLKGLTCGHDVAPGECSGSVIGMYRTKDLTIENCRLYGSGTYGVDTYESEYLTVIDTDIYECTEGIASLYSANNIVFRACRFYNNSGYKMLGISSCWGVLFEDTVFNDNTADSDDYCPIDMYEVSYDVIFRNCEFRDNEIEPDPALLPDIIFENCTIPEAEAVS